MAEEGHALGDEMESKTPFSQPWRSSNLVLVVEGRKFYVHRDVLIVCSPVFEAMLSSDFKEKSALEIPLPEKKAEEIEQLLKAIYPDREFSITKENCFFLLALSFEYHINVLTARCENFISTWYKNDMTLDEAMELIVLSQKYPLNDETVQGCMKSFVSQEKRSWEDLRKHKLFLEVEPVNVQRITEERVKFLESKEPNSDLATTFFRKQEEERPSRERRNWQKKGWRRSEPNNSWQGDDSGWY